MSSRVLSRCAARPWVLVDPRSGLCYSRRSGPWFGGPPLCELPSAVRWFPSLRAARRAAPSGFVPFQLPVGFDVFGWDGPLF